MAIPLTLIQRAKNLLLFGPLDVSLDPLVSGEWDQQRDSLCREYDLFTRVSVLAAMAGKSIYSVPAGATRIFSVIFNGQTLGYSDRANLDLTNADWETDDPSTPRFWSYNAVPGDVDVPVFSTVTITPREFIIYPAPDGANANATAITLITQYQQDTIPHWLEPVLLYLTVAEIATENPNCAQPEKGKWFNDLAHFWMESARRLMQV